jgi:hypothetical protein
MENEKWPLRHRAGVRSPFILPTTPCAALTRLRTLRLEESDIVVLRPQIPFSIWTPTKMSDLI